MNALSLSYLGFFLGLIVTQMAVRWALAIVVVLEKRWTYDEEPRQRRTLLWALPIVLLLHSGPWAIAVVTLVVFEFLSVPHSAGWNWFFGGFLLSVGFVAFAAFVGHLRAMKIPARRSA